MAKRKKQKQLPSVKVYTRKYEPFQFGGPLYRMVATTITDYAVTDIGRGYRGLMVKNPCRKLWHVFLEACGALIGTGKTRAAVLLQVVDDTRTGNKELMVRQIEQGKIDCASAEELPPDEFFKFFSEK